MVEAVSELASDAAEILPCLCRLITDDQLGAADTDDCQRGTTTPDTRLDWLLVCTRRWLGGCGSPAKKDESETGEGNPLDGMSCSDTVECGSACREKWLAYAGWYDEDVSDGVLALLEELRMGLIIPLERCNWPTNAQTSKQTNKHKFNELVGQILNCGHKIQQC